MQSTDYVKHTLGDFVRHTATLLTKEQGGFPYSDDTSWHKMLLHIRDKYVELEPFRSIVFAYDDSTYPTCTKMSEFLEALHWSGALSVDNPAFNTAKIKPDLLNIWEKELDKQDREYKEIIKESVAKLQEFNKSY